MAKDQAWEHHPPELQAAGRADAHSVLAPQPRRAWAPVRPAEASQQFA